MMTKIASCPIARTLIAGIAFALISQFISCFIWGTLFHDETMAHAHLWRAETDPLMWQACIAGNLLVGLGVAFAYKCLYHGLACCGSSLAKGLKLGFLLFLIVGVGHSVQWYAFSPISQKLVLVSILNQAVVLLLGTSVVALIFGTLPEKCGIEQAQDKKSCCPMKKA